jgi:alcohol dehydrogenase
MDVVESRLEFCRETYGVRHTVLFKGDGSEIDEMLAITGGDNYAVVTDATGSDKSMSNALADVAHTGLLVYLDITTKEISFFQVAMHKPELTIKSSRNALPADFTRIISLIEDGTINTGPWITHRTSFADVVGEFETFTRPESEVIKAVIEVA